MRGLTKASAGASLLADRRSQALVRWAACCGGIWVMSPNADCARSIVVGFFGVALPFADWRRGRCWAEGREITWADCWSHLVVGCGVSKHRWRCGGSSPQPCLMNLKVNEMML